MTKQQVDLTQFRQYGVSLNKLQGSSFGDLTWVIPDMLPREGVAMIFGAPKLGKSVFVLNVILHAAVGGYGTGELSTLYIALESSHRREQKRIKLIMDGKPFPHNIYLETKWELLEYGGMARLEEYLAQQHTDIVVIDTWGALRTGKRNANQSLYQAERAEIEQLQDMAYKHDTLIWLVHHTRKDKSGTWADGASGSNAVIGTCDTIMCYSGDENSTKRLLQIKGRDIDESAYTVHYNKDTMKTTISDIKHADSPIYGKIIKHMRECEMMQKPQDVATAIKENVSTVNVYMLNLVVEGALLNDGRGKYVIRLKSSSV